ncbi:MAG: exonuclease domain-containing protein [Candidatus Fimenecus sp.]
MNYIVMDMEWNTAYCKQLGGFLNEIIEIGAVKLNESLQETDTFSVIIKSQIGKRLQSRVKTLTHLTNDDIANGVSFQKAIMLFTAWLGTQENTFLTWGDGDIRTLIKNCDYFLNTAELPFVHHYCDLQKYCQSFTDAASSGQQLGLSAAAEKLGVNPDDYPHHRALDDSRLSAACLQRVFDAAKLKKYTRRCDKDFYARLAFKPYYISDINNPLVDKKQFRCVCDICGGKVKREKNWKYSNNSFRAVFYCKHCNHRFRVAVRYKQLYDRLEVRKTFTEVKEEPPEQSSQPSISVTDV